MALKFDITFRHVNTEYQLLEPMPATVFMYTRLALCATHAPCLGLLTLVQSFTCFHFLGSTIAEFILSCLPVRYIICISLSAVLLRFDNGSIMQNLSPLSSSSSTLNTLTNVLTAEQTNKFKSIQYHASLFPTVDYKFHVSQRT